MIRNKRIQRFKDVPSGALQYLNPTYPLPNAPTFARIERKNKTAKDMNLNIPNIYSSSPYTLTPRVVMAEKKTQNIKAHAYEGMVSSDIQYRRTSTAEFQSSGCVSIELRRLVLKFVKEASGSISRTRCEEHAPHEIV